MPTYFSPAKINLFLHVLGKRPDGFHDLETVFQAVDWGDTIELEKSSTEGDQLVLSGPAARGVPGDGSNLVLRAVAKLRHRHPSKIPALSVKLHKEIPPGSGLGGGSSNAAATLVALNELLGLGHSDAELEGIAAGLGSDCAFFVRGGTQFGRGRGEVLEPVPRLRQFALLIGIPPVRVSTAEAFALLSTESAGSRTDAAALRRWLETGKEQDLPRLANSFEQGVSVRHPEIGGLLASFERTDPLAAGLSGSGSACFGIYRNREAAEWARSLIPGMSDSVKVCSPYSYGSGRRADL